MDSTRTWRAPASPEPAGVPRWAARCPALEPAAPAPLATSQAHATLPPPTHHQRRGRGGSIALWGVRLLIVLAAALAPFLIATPRGSTPALSGYDASGEPFLRAAPVVVASDRMVCALLSSQLRAAGVEGQDTGGTVVVDGTVYWTFGDTVLEDGAMLPNLVGSSPDADASDCLSLAPSEHNGRATPLLDTVLAGELTVWPLGMEATAADTVHFFYASVDGPGGGEWRVRGVGIASFDTNDLTASRDLGGTLLWPAGGPLPTRTFADDLYVYAFLDVSRAPWTTETVLARVPKGAVDSPGRYQYWDEGAPGRPGRWVPGLWDPETAAWNQGIDSLGPLWVQAGMHNGVEVAYNEFLGRWLAVYSAGFMSTINARTAEKLTGPWTGPETVLVGCPAFHPDADRGFLCYSGAQHEFYSRDGDRTIYISYSNTDTYQPYLHELRLAAPIRQWRDEDGRVLYLPAKDAAPAGFRAGGIAFYASDIAAPGFLAIHRWERMDTGQYSYGVMPPGPRLAYRDLGADFYLPASAAAARATNTPYAPVYRWTLGDEERYSPLDLRSGGYIRMGTAFYAPCPDGDGDTLSDCQESFLKTSPRYADSDGDSLGDGFEVATKGCDPLRRSDDGDGVPAGEELLAGTNPCT